MNNEIISLMKSRIDELTEDEFCVIRNYCEQKAIEIHNQKERMHSGYSVGAQMVRRVIQMAEGEQKI